MEREVKIITKNGEVVTAFTMGPSTHKDCDCELEFEKNSRFYRNGEWFLVVYQYHSQSDVVIPCNVYSRYSSLINKSAEIRNADFILIDDKPLPQYNGKLKAAFAIC